MAWFVNTLRRLLGLLRWWWLVVVVLDEVVVQNPVKFVLVSADNTCTCHPIQTITWGQTVPLSGSNTINGAMLRDGLRAAFKEHNDKVIPNKKFTLALQTIDDKIIPATALANVQTFLKNPDIFGIAGSLGSATVEAYAPLAIANGLPVLSAYGGMPLRTPFVRNIINFRGSTMDESSAVVEHLVSLNKRRIAFFGQDDALGDAAIIGVKAALASNNLYIHAISRYTKMANATVWTTQSQQAILDILNFRTKTIPDAIVLAAQYEPSAIFMYTVRQKWPDMYFGCLSSASGTLLLTKFQALNSPPEMYRNIFISQVVPPPFDASVPIIKAYLDATAKLGNIDASFLGLEAYIIGRIISTALGRISGYNLTREAFMNVIYDKSYFNFDGFRFGPFLPADINGGCNQGMHSIYMTRVKDNVTIDTIGTLDFAGCGYQPKVWETIRFGQSCTFNGSQGSLCLGFRDGLLAAFKKVNDAGGIRGTTKLDLIAKDDNENTMKALMNNVNFLEDDAIFGLIGTSVLSITEISKQVTKHNKILFGAFTGDNSLREPFQREIVNFRASVDDEVYAIVYHCYYVAEFTKVSLEVALQEKRWSLLTESGYTAANLTESINRLFHGAGSELQAIVFIGLDDVIANVLVQVQTHNPKVIVFGLSQTVTDSLALVADKINLNNFIVTTVVPDVTDSSIEVVQQYIAALAELDTLPQPSSAGLEGFIVGELLATALNRIMGKPLTVANLLESLYENGNFNVFGLRCGPFLEVTSNSSSRESCNQCMKQVYLTIFNSTVDNAYKTFAFEDTCMYEPAVSLDFQLSGVRMIMTTLSGICIGYTVIIMILVIFYRNNPHVRATSYKFTLVSCVGGIFCYIGIFIIYPVPTDTSCALEPWIADLAFVTLFGPIFAKTYRIDRIFNNKKIKHHVISDYQVFRTFFTLVLVFMGFQVVYSLMNRPYMQEVITSSKTRFEDCTTDSDTFAYIDTVLKAVLLVWGCFLCQRVYKIHGQFARFNESKQLVVCIYHTTFLAMCMLLLGMTTKDNPNVHFACVSGILLENTMLVITILYGHPVYKALTNRPLDDPNDESSSNASSGHNVLSGSGTASNVTSTNGSFAIKPVRSTGTFTTATARLSAAQSAHNLVVQQVTAAAAASSSPVQAVQSVTVKPTATASPTPNQSDDQLQPSSLTPGMLEATDFE